NVLRGIESSYCPVCDVAVFVLFEIASDRLPAPNIVPIETRLDHQNAVSFFHDRVIERNSRELGEAVAQSVFQTFRGSNLRNEVGQFRSVAIELAQYRWHRPNKHSRIPAKISFPQKRLGQIDIWFFAKP